MDRNRWETAIRCLEVAVHPNTRDDEMVAAVNGFRRTVEGTPLSQVCIEFSCGGIALDDLAKVKDSLERLNRENQELRRKLAVEEAAHATVARRLDTAYRRIYELTQEAEAAARLADAVREEFAEFRVAYARVVDGGPAKLDLERVLDDAAKAVAEPATEPVKSFSAFLAEARLRAAQAASYVGSGNGSGRLQPGEPLRPWQA